METQWTRNVHVNIYVQSELTALQGAILDLTNLKQKF